MTLETQEARKMSVLIADDSAITRRNLREMLAEYPAVGEIGETENFIQSRDYIRGVRPHLVIADIRMPGGSGIEVVREANFLDKPPIMIVLTNYPYEQFHKESLLAGADFFFDKTKDLGELRKILSLLTQIFRKGLL